MAQEIIQENAWLYRVHDGKFECFNGTVFLFRDRGLYKFVRTEDQVYLDHYSIKRTKAMIAVSDIPGEVYNNTVWLQERNDKKARQFFRVHYTAELVSHTEQISKLNSYILTVMTGEL